MTIEHCKAWALRWRARIIPERLGLGWTPLVWLFYLGFLFLPVVFGWIGVRETAWTIATIPVFLALYVWSFRCDGWRMLGPITGTAALALLLQPLNPFANTYMIYVAASAAFLGSLPRALTVFGLFMVAYTTQIFALGQAPFIPAITALVGASVCLGNWQWLQRHMKDAALRLSHEEVRRLAQLAERERIGRDLHDLLGHTLSLIALKAELACKLFDRDPATARNEIAEVERVARDALAQVRRAVTGIRAAALAPELASARLLLDGAGIDFRQHLAEIDLPAGQETCLALVLREAITNVHRHARAHTVEVSLRREGGQVILTVLDDGRGGVCELGNGLTGMSERVAALGGELRVVSPPGDGTRVVATLPLQTLDSDDTVTPFRAPTRSAA